MEEETGFNGFTPSDYANGLYEDAKVNAQRRDRLLLVAALPKPK